MAGAQPLFRGHLISSGISISRSSAAPLFSGKSVAKKTPRRDKFSDSAPLSAVSDLCRRMPTAARKLCLLDGRRSAVNFLRNPSMANLRAPGLARSRDCESEGGHENPTISRVRTGSSSYHWWLGGCRGAAGALIFRISQLLKELNVAWDHKQDATPASCYHRSLLKATRAKTPLRCTAQVGSS
jgi:hypothetical protein